MSKNVRRRGRWRARRKQGNWFTRMKMWQRVLVCFAGVLICLSASAGGCVGGPGGAFDSAGGEGGGPFLNPQTRGGSSDVP